MLDLDVSGEALNGAMVNAELKLSESVSLRGIRPEMALVLQEVPKVFFRHGFDCWLTSGVRPKSRGSLHSVGLALDFDASTHITQEEGQLIADELGQNLSREYQVLWHKTKRGNWHLHVEFDFDGRGMVNYA